MPSAAQVSAGAVRTVSKAAELFLGLVAEKALAAAAKGKRKTINFADVQKAAQDRRMVEMGLQDIFIHEVQGVNLYSHVLNFEQSPILYSDFAIFGLHKAICRATSDWHTWATSDWPTCRKSR